LSIESLEICNRILLWVSFADSISKPFRVYTEELFAGATSESVQRVSVTTRVDIFHQTEKRTAERVLNLYSGFDEASRNSRSEQSKFSWQESIERKVREFCLIYSDRCV
jgi:hypothetical protein